MRGSVATLHSPEYNRLLEELVAMRRRAGFSQRELARRIGKGHRWLDKSEVGERRLDVYELALAKAAARTSTPSCAGSGFSRRRMNPALPPP